MIKPKRKPSAERRAIAEVRAKLIMRATGCCEQCGRWLGDNGHAHHRIKRSHGGTWALDNLVYLCAADHMRAHGIKVIEH